ncbi:MAG: 3-phosphoshikimate 1-carboxyvinyltransferase [Janthinobacterium lividum]
MKQLELGPYSRASGTLALPGSKSISNRVLLMAALAEGETRLENLLESDDTRVMLDALRLLGIEWAYRPASSPAAAGSAASGESWRVTGAPAGFPVRDADIFVGNAGTAVRPLTAALALNEGSYRISGVKRMHERPIGDLVDGLLAVGARIDYLGQPGFPPLQIHPGQTAGAGVERPIRVRGDVSSQFLSALLLSLPRLSAHGRATVEVEGELISKPYVDITTGLMARFGVPVEREGWQRFSVAAGSRYRSPGTLVVEGDASSASYFLAAGALGGGPLRVEGVGSASIQGDVRFADALTQMGANVMMGEHWIEVRGVDTADGRLRPIDMDFNLIPDAAMTIAVAALHASGPSTLRNIGSWRVKETDRISAMATELRKVGADVQEGPDWLRVVPPAQLCAGAVIDTYDDHRMAMCFSLVSLLGVPVTINDPDCVAKTFPDYFDRFAQVVR